jgi:hypothetical protein
MLATIASVTTTVAAAITPFHRHYPYLLLIYILVWIQVLMMASIRAGVPFAFEFWQGLVATLSLVPENASDGPSETQTATAFYVADGGRARSGLFLTVAAVFLLLPPPKVGRGYNAPPRSQYMHP